MRAICCLLAVVGSLGAVHAETKPTAEAIELFEKKIRPVFAEHCYSCHGEKKQQAGLRLDRKAAFFKGSDGGPVVVPGDPEKSPLIKNIRHEGEYKMPPKMKLPQAVIDTVTAWVKSGAPYPDDAPGAVVADPTKTHWAFQPVKDPAPPATKTPKSQTIDRFVQAKLETKNIGISPEADKRTLLRRATHDLTGLPPSVEETERFLNDRSPQAYENLLDRLLASPAYGEHQARHWMDIARYADTKGYVFQEDRNYPYAYTYRDWLIRSFNEDVPYDQFILQQLAADKLADADKRSLAAMGFLTVGRRYLNSQPDIIDDRLDVTFRGFQALTVTCARCHDHKYDPIPTKDYYSLYGVFGSSVEPKDLPLLASPAQTAEAKAFDDELKKRETATQTVTDKLRGDYLGKLKTPAALAGYLRAARDVRGLKPADAGTLAAERKLFAVVLTGWQTYLDGRSKAADPLFGPYHAISKITDAEFAAKAPEQLAKLLQETDPKKLSPVVREAFAGKKIASWSEFCAIYGELLAKNSAGPMAKPEIAEILGDKGPLNLDERKFMRILTVAEQNQVRDLRRKADEWKAKSPAAPPRAMVMNDGPVMEPVVFVRGNPGNHGPKIPRQFVGLLQTDRKPFTQGSGRLEMAKAIASPDNPLTARVMVNRIWGHLFGQGLVRTPSDFGVRSEPPTHPELLDWVSKRFVESGWSLKKLHRLVMLSETYRQSSAVPASLAATDPENRLLGRMTRKRLAFEATRDAVLFAAGRLDRTVGGRSVELFEAPHTTRRAVYGFIDRQNLPGTLRSFDFASPDTHSPQRFVTTVPQQALFLMNSPFLTEQAKAMAARLKATEPGERINELYQLTVSRSPTAEELALAREFIMMPAAMETPAAEVWLYGQGYYNAATKKTLFTKLPHYTGTSYQGGAALPDPKLGWCVLNSLGGHAGNDQSHAVIRRWTAPKDGTVSINGELHHPSKEGDGVRGRVISSRTGQAGEWNSLGTKLETPVPALAVKKGDTIDFITDCRTNPNNDSFQWTVRVNLKSAEDSKVYDSAMDFAGPKTPVKSLGAWEQLAQVMLLGNEFAFVD